MISCADRLEVRALSGVPVVAPGDDLGALAVSALGAAGVELVHGDVLVVSSKVVSRAEGRFVDVSTVSPSTRALELGKAIGKDPRAVELVLRESVAVSRQAPGVLVVRHRLGFVVANAGIDMSNAMAPGAPAGQGPWVLLLPVAPDASAAAVRRALEASTGGRARVGVVVSDSFGRPFRLGTVGAAIGVSGLPPLWDRRGERDLFGRPLELTVTALADQVAAVADLVAGQAAEGRPLVLVRGLSFDASDESAAALQRRPEEDLYA
jgi:coenzyme F420-0:L-glutamate ligase / coenzyme F420-1:gamma-L-glutamate ligase